MGDNSAVSGIMKGSVKKYKISMIIMYTEDQIKTSFSFGVLAKHGELLSPQGWWKRLFHKLALETAVSMASSSL